MNQIIIKAIFGKKSGKTDQAIQISKQDFDELPKNYMNYKLAFSEQKKIEFSSFNSKPFLELFNYDDISLWWFFQWEEFLPRYSSIINFIDKFSTFLVNEKINLIEIEDDYAYFKAIQQICKKMNITFQYSKIKFFKFKITDFFFQNLKKLIRGYRLKKRIKQQIKKHLSLYSKDKFSQLTFNDSVLVASPMSYRRQIYNSKKRIYEDGEHITGPIIDILKDDFNVIGISIPFIEKGKTDDVLIKRLNSELDWLPEEIILMNSNNKSQKVFLKNYKKLIKTRQFQNIFQYDNIFVWEHVKEAFFNMLYDQYFPYWLNQIDSYAKFFSQYKPRAILLPSETDPPALSIINAAKKNNVKTIAIQHGLGIEDPEHSVSIIKSDEFKFGCPFPDIMLVFGNYTKQRFIEHGYPAERFIVFGNPMFLDYDEYFLYDSKSLLQKYGLDDTKTIITFTSSKNFSPFQKYNFDLTVWKYLLDNFSNNDNFFLILKPHPFENISLFENELKEHNNKNIKIVNGNLLEIISLSDILISNTSTAIMDSICMKKPIIEIKWDGIRQIPYEKYGVVFLRNLDELANSILSLSNNDNIKNSLEKNTSFFLREQYNIPTSKQELKSILLNLLN